MVVIDHFEAVENKDESLMDYLVVNGQGVNDASGIYQRTPLHLACEQSDATMVRLLLKRGADPTCRDVNDWTPLHFASLSGNEHALHLLLKHPDCPNVDAATTSGKTALHLCAGEGHLRCMKVSHDTHLFDIDQSSNSGFEVIDRR